VLASRDRCARVHPARRSAHKVAHGRTLNHQLRKPYIPLPPALPRFSLPHESREAGDDLDVEATAQRPTIRPGRASTASVRVRKKISADATAEVQLEDILLEVYAEDPPPPMTRRSPGVDPRVESAEARDSIAMAIASIVPPGPAQSAAVDALLRASDPAFTPPRADYETPSFGPMMLATAAPPARPVIRDARAARSSRGLAIAIWAIVITVVGVAAGAAMVLGARNGTFARMRDGAKSMAARATSKHEAPVAVTAASTPARVASTPEVPVAPPSTAVVAPASAVSPAPAPSSVPTVSIDSLPKPAIANNESLVTFPAYAQGHRVFLDGRVLPVASGTPTTIKCGRHMLKIGSARRPRVLDFACGREVIVQ
jgi:hypothetical protein